MVNKNPGVVWSDEAKQQLKAAYKFIKKDSVQNAEKVRGDIVTNASELAKHPDRYNPDKYKLSNDGSYRAFEKHRYRVAYRVLKNEIRILRVRHTSMEPKQY
ncbi:MAG TPA: type II toxin-antitoxin system RelE/ParE family toxin [Hanamia sp.]|nr:type II toxin-antitoxin system RelE/ParE family toxin [Hanamia sp.]